MYQCLNSCAYTDKFEKIYICGGAVVELPALLREIEENNLSPDRLGIHPLVGIVQEIDVEYESGRADLDGKPKDTIDSANLKIGSTLHGVGAARARRILRRPDVLLARDIKELKPFICDTREEIVNRLDRGQSGLLEIAQGFQLGYLEHRFYPKTTSRNCTVAAGLDDCGIPPYYAGPVIGNVRTYPIRVNSNKYLHKETGKILNYEEMKNLRSELVTVIEGDSGAFYEDQVEITWDEISQNLGRDVIELSSLTKLPRRVFTFSTQNLIEAIRYNRTDYPYYVSINFANYVDPELEGVSQPQVDSEFAQTKFNQWLNDNVTDALLRHNGKLAFIGTGPKLNHMIQVTRG